MSDEISLSKGWSLEAYIAHNESMRVEEDRRYMEKFEAADKAIKKAEAASEKRFESINEFRATLSDQATQFASQEKVNDLVSRFDRLEARSSGEMDATKHATGERHISSGQLIAIAAVIVSIAAIVVAVILKP